MAHALTTGELATELEVSPRAVQNWARRGFITPAFITPGGHMRWHLDDVRAEIRATVAARSGTDGLPG